MSSFSVNFCCKVKKELNLLFEKKIIFSLIFYIGHGKQQVFLRKVLIIGINFNRKNALKFKTLNK